MPEIPDRLKGFPIYQGNLVHYTVFVGADGVPDFKLIHEAHRLECMREHLCNLCGQGLEEVIAFVGGDKCEQSRLFADGPMHDECARYAILVCPFLNNPGHGHAKEGLERSKKKHKDALVMENQAVAPGRPRMALFHTTGYSVVRYMGALYYHAEPFTKVDYGALPNLPK